MVREGFSEEVKREDFTKGGEKMFMQSKWYVQSLRIWPTQGMTDAIKGTARGVISFMPHNSNTPFVKCSQV